MTELRGLVEYGVCELCRVRGRVVPAYYGPRLCGSCCVDEAFRMDTEGSWPRPIWEWPCDPAIGVLACVNGAFGLFYGQALASVPVFRSFQYPASLRHFLEAGAPALPELADIWVHDSALAVIPHGPNPDVVPWSKFGRFEIVVPREWGVSRADGSAYVNSSPWWGLEPLELYHELCAFSGALGRRFSYSPASTSDWLVWDLWGPSKIRPTELPEGLEVETAPDFELDDAGVASTRLEWPLFYVDRTGIPPASGGRGRWCYGFDLNGSYLGAASNLSLPTGTPMHFAGHAAETDPARGLPGYWTRGDRRWRTSPGLVAGELVQGWGYRAHHQYLQPWYRRLRDARAALVPGPALSAVKAVYQAGWARFMSANRSDSDWARRLYQPYWSQAIQANARSRLSRRIDALPVRPAAVDTDCVFVFSKREDARVVALELGLELGAGLGQWKVYGRCAGKEARHILANPDEAAAIRELRDTVKKGNQG